MPLNDKKFRLCDTQVLGNAADEMCTDTVDLGITSPGLEGLGPQWGLHMIVTTTYTGLASGAILWIVHSAADDLSAGSIPGLVGMFIPVASLVAGCHFFVPVPKGIALKRYVGAVFDIVNQVATAGASTCWLGPDTDVGNEP